MSKFTRKIPGWLRRKVLERDGYTCHHCGRHSWFGMTIDHVKPLALGGDGYDPANLAVSCRSCNAAKGARVA